MPNYPPFQSATGVKCIREIGWVDLCVATKSECPRNPGAYLTKQMDGLIFNKTRRAVKLVKLEGRWKS